MHAKLEQRGAAMESNDVNRTPPGDSALEVRVHLVHVPRLGAVGGGSGITSPFRVGYPLQISLPHRPRKASTTAWANMPTDNDDMCMCMYLVMILEPRRRMRMWMMMRMMRMRMRT